MYVNVFRSRRRADIDAAAYAAEAERMEELARQQAGFISYQSYAADDGEKVSISEWQSEAHALAWASNAEHRVAQGHGRSDYYESYVQYCCADPRIARFERREP